MIIKAWGKFNFKKHGYTKKASRKRKLDSENGTTPTKNGAIPTKKHKFLSLSEKIEIIKYHENGASYAKIC